MARIPTNRVATHPGEFLREIIEDEEVGMSGNALAKALGVPPNRITRLISGVTGVSVDTAFRLGRYFDMTPDFWMNAQMAYDLSTARMDKQLQTRIKTDVRPRETEAA
ncbi:MAG: HigA family addiction module antitoxin [Alphaproteobacteria bacterium]